MMRPLDRVRKFKLTEHRGREKMHKPHHFQIVADEDPFPQRPTGQRAYWMPLDRRVYRYNPF